MSHMRMGKPSHAKRVMRLRTQALIKAGLMWAATGVVLAGAFLFNVPFFLVWFFLAVPVLFLLLVQSTLSRAVRQAYRTLDDAGLTELSDIVACNPEVAQYVAAILDRGGEPDGWDLAWAQKLEVERQVRQVREMAEEARQAARQQLADAVNRRQDI